MNGVIVVRIALFLAILWAAALAHFAFLRSGRRLRAASYMITAGAVLAAPFLLPADQRIVRFAFAVMAFTFAAKMHDLGDPRTTKLPALREFAFWLVNPTSLVWRKLAAEPSPTKSENLRRAARGALVTLVSAAVFAGAWLLHLERVSFVLEHVVKALGFWGMTVGALDILLGFWRIYLGKARDPMQDIFRAKTPAEFWRRYNRAVGQFFYEDLFPHFGGVRHPVRATLLVFAFSSLLHEYVAAVAIGAVQGYQTAFFMLQGIGVALTLRARPTGATAVLAILLTAIFNLATVVLFLTTFQQVAPFWAVAPFRP
jgi:hypothetical protein